MNAAHEPAPAAEPSATPTSPLLEGLRVELRRLVDGDIDGNLMQIEQLAARGRDLLMVLKAPEAKLLNRRPPQPTTMSTYNLSQGVNVTGTYQAEPGSFPEQYGAASMRQLTNILPDAIDKIVRAFAQGPQRMVAAIIAARAAGQDALANKLEERLLKQADGEYEHEPSEAAPHHHTNGAAAVSQPAPQPAE
jgi:hypothetical protein